MKSTAVQYPPSFTVALAELTRVSARYGHAAYATSLVLAGLALAGSIFYGEIRYTFGAHVFGVRAMTLWEAAFVLVTLAWLMGTTLGVMCLPQRGRPRTFGVSSIGMNLAAALLVATTLA